MLILKDSSVIHDGLSQELHYALGIATVLYQMLGDTDCVVTSLVDGQHNSGSLHPAGKAADLRTKTLSQPQRQAIYSALKRYLDPIGFDVVWEGAGATEATTNQHIHIELDPKGCAFWRTGASHV